MIALAREADRLLDGCQPDPNSIPESVAKISYRPFAECCARIKQMGLAPQLLDQLTNAATVAALARAWAVDDA